MEATEIPPKVHKETRTLVRGPRRVLSGFGRAMHASGFHGAPVEIETLKEILQRASTERVPVAFRGTGNSYGDASLNQDGLTLDLSGMNRILSWDPQTGLIDVEPGVTIRDIWEHTLPYGYWPPIVPGTMKPTLGGCAAMNIHGKNNFRKGPIGDHIEEFDLLTPGGELDTYRRDRGSDVFHGAISGLGMLGAFTRLRLRLNKVQTGNLQVESLCSRNLEETFDLFEEHLGGADYLVGWLDAMVDGKPCGRSVIHRATYLEASRDPEPPERTLRAEYQNLPPTIFGFPRALAWLLLRPATNDLGMRALNFGKYWAARAQDRKSYRQSLVAFSFLLDYIPEWRKAYGEGGFIQYQPFVPKENARRVFREILDRMSRAGLPSYLVVMKRHLPDDFLLTHAVDGYSLAMDIKVTRSNRDKVWNVAHQLSDLVVEAGGRFYFAKDAVVRPIDVERAWGLERLQSLKDLKARLDPENVLQSDLFRRILSV